MEGCGDANVGVVGKEAMAYAIIGSLYESTSIIGNPSCEKNTDLIHGKIIIGGKIRCLSVMCAFRSSGEGSLHEGGNWQFRQNPAATLHGVAGDFEKPAKWRELGAKTTHMASRARLTCLRRKSRYRLR